MVVLENTNESQYIIDPFHAKISVITSILDTRINHTPTMTKSAMIVLIILTVYYV